MYVSTCKKAGAERVSKSATLELTEVLNEVGIKIAKETIKYTLYARRRTVRAVDIKAAYEKLSNRRSPIVSSHEYPKFFKKERQPCSNHSIHRKQFYLFLEFSSLYRDYCPCL